MRDMLGTFTDPSGPAGNYISLELVPEEMKPQSAKDQVIKASFGRGHSSKIFGSENIDLQWGYTEYKPLTICLTGVDEKRTAMQPAAYLIIVAVDHNHLNVRTRKIDTTPQAPLLFPNNASKILVRTGESAFPVPNF